MTPVKMLAVGACALTLTACETGSGDHALGGLLIGGALGGVAGSQFGHGGGKTAMTALGIALGAYVGHEIGRKMDERDQAAHDHAAQVALGDHRTGRPYAWRGTHGAHGSVAPTSEVYADTSGRSCRRFTDTVVFEDGHPQDVSGVACLNRDGQWAVAQR